MFPARPKSTLPPNDVSDAGRPEQDRGVEDVRADDPTRRKRNTVISMIAISVPLPAELRPITKPVVAPMPTAATL